MLKLKVRKEKYMESEREDKDDTYRKEKRVTGATRKIRKNSVVTTEQETIGKVGKQKGDQARRKKYRTKSIRSILDFYDKKRVRSEEKGEKGEKRATNKRCNSTVI